MVGYCAIAKCELELLTTMSIKAPFHKKSMNEKKQQSNQSGVI